MRADLEPSYLQVDQIYLGNSLELMQDIEPNSVALSFWSPPYFVGKEYERNMCFEDWQALLSEAISLHYGIIKPGGFVVVNIADILVFPDPKMPKIQANNITRQKAPIDREMVLDVMADHPDWNRYQIAEFLGVSEQTVDRRLNGNNIRGGKYSTQTRVKIVGGLIEDWAVNAGFFLYDRRVWVKDPAWENSKWHSLSYRAIDEFEYLYVFWKPGITTVNRNRLQGNEWSEWGSRAVWRIPSVRANDDHPAKFPEALASRVIRLLTDEHDVVLDPFLGSGTTAVVASQLNRHYVGIERMPEYVESARNRLNKERLSADDQPRRSAGSTR